MHPIVRLLAVVLLLAALPAHAFAVEPAQVAHEIERFIQLKLKEAKVPASPLADDAEFLRRVYLDLTGRIPTYDEAVAFLDNTSENKRTQLIDELLERSDYGTHFATIWRDLLVDRSSDMNQVRNFWSWEFLTWLAQGFNEDRGWNDLVTEMLLAEGEAKSNPSTVMILSNRMNGFPRPEAIVASSGKLFLGIQIGCAQCHDHPYVEEWKHNDFWGLAAFFSQLRDHGMDGNGGSQNPNLLETPITDTEKNRRYEANLKRQAFIPPVPGAKIAVPNGTVPGESLRMVNAKFLLGEEPTLSEAGPYRGAYAAWLTAAENPYFAKATVNRLWAHFFATGIVNPIDDLSPLNKPSHPELLDLLARELIANKFQLKPIIRAICNSPAYQRTSRPLPEQTDKIGVFSHYTLKLLSPDQMVNAVSIASGRTPQTGKNREQSTAMFATKEADAPAAEFSHGIPQFLYQMNGNTSNQTPNFMGKFTNGKKSEEAIVAMYVAVLSRRPTEGELEKVKAYVADASTPSQAYRDLYWVLLNSAEFMFVH